MTDLLDKARELLAGNEIIYGEWVAHDRRKPDRQTIAALAKGYIEAMETIANERARAEAAEAERDRLREALRPFAFALLLAVLRTYRDEVVG